MPLIKSRFFRMLSMSSSSLDPLVTRLYPVPEGSTIPIRMEAILLRRTSTF